MLRGGEMRINRAGDISRDFCHVTNVMQAKLPTATVETLADIGKARRLLGYEPTHSIEQGLDESLDWYEKTLG
jgi:nucleoside-diphosphate-sugar epimerase